jgi:hypothetical protein
MSLREIEHQRFRDIVDHGGFDEPPQLPDFDHGGGGGRFPNWSTHVAAFLLGGITFCALIFTPMFVPVLALAAIVGFVWLAVKRRWR